MAGVIAHLVIAREIAKLLPDGTIVDKGLISIHFIHSILFNESALFDFDRIAWCFASECIKVLI